LDRFLEPLIIIKDGVKSSSKVLPYKEWEVYTELKKESCRVVHRSPPVADRAKKETHDHNMPGNVAVTTAIVITSMITCQGGGGSRRLRGMAKIDHEAGRTRGA
jgi:hypothetical protein